MLLPAKTATISTSCPFIIPDHGPQVVTDVTIRFRGPADAPSTAALDLRAWHRIDKELHLHAPTAQARAWLYIAQAHEEALTADDLVVTDITVGECPSRSGPDDNTWESRPGGIWVRRRKYPGIDHHRHLVTGVDVLFGSDAVDPRPGWSLTPLPLELNSPPEMPVARLSVRHGRDRAGPRSVSAPKTLRAREDGRFKIVQISDPHMVTGPGVCRDAIDANGQVLPECKADPLTVEFIGQVLDVEKPDLVVLTGDQLHGSSAPDSQSALFKLVAPFIERSIPYAAVFGNHDDEGPCTLSRTEQMSLLQSLPFSLCVPGPSEVAGVGNYYLQIFDPVSSRHPVATLYFLDSHGEISSSVRDPDYGWITQSQTDWFTRSSRELREARSKDGSHRQPHLSLAFMHIPLPEYAESDLIIRGGSREEAVMCPTFNSHFYDALAEEGVAAVGCGHDHVNDFCGLRPHGKQLEQRQGGSETRRVGPWLCCGGSCGFGAYGSHGGKYYHRRMRVWELDCGTGDLKTWKRVEYATGRVDELVLVERGEVVAPS